MVQIHPDPPNFRNRVVETEQGAIAQLGERLLCKQEVTGSIPVGSTFFRVAPTFSRGCARATLVVRPTT